MAMDALPNVSSGSNDEPVSFPPPVSGIAQSKEAMDAEVNRDQFLNGIPLRGLFGFEDWNDIPLFPSPDTTLQGTGAQVDTEMTFGELYQQGGEFAFGTEPNEEAISPMNDVQAVGEPSWGRFEEAPAYDPSLKAKLVPLSDFAKHPAEQGFSEPGTRGIAPPENYSKSSDVLSIEQAGLEAFGRNMLSRECPQCYSKTQTSIEALAMHIFPPVLEKSRLDINNVYFDARIRCSSCNASICLGCSRLEPAPRHNLYQQPQQIPFSYPCCDKGRLVILWMLLGADLDGMGETLAEVYFRALARALPSLGIHSQFDINPPGILGAMIRRSTLVHKIHDILVAMEHLKMLQWRRVHMAVMGVVKTLRAHPSTSFIVFEERHNFPRGLFLTTFPSVDPIRLADASAPAALEVMEPSVALIDRLAEKIRVEGPAVNEARMVAQQHARHNSMEQL